MYHFKFLFAQTRATFQMMMMMMMIMIQNPVNSVDQRAAGSGRWCWASVRAPRCLGDPPLGPRGGQEHWRQVGKP